MSKRPWVEHPPFSTYGVALRKCRHCLHFVHRYACCAAKTKLFSTFFAVKIWRSDVIMQMLVRWCSSGFGENEFRIVTSEHRGKCAILASPSKNQLASHQSLWTVRRCAHPGPKRSAFSAVYLILFPRVINYAIIAAHEVVRMCWPGRISMYQRSVR